jgi:hypothetical protein
MAIGSSALTAREAEAPFRDRLDVKWIKQHLGSLNSNSCVLRASDNKLVSGTCHVYDNDCVDLNYRHG